MDRSMVTFQRENRLLLVWVKVLYLNRIVLQEKSNYLELKEIKTCK
jgi:hypothetical protein